MGFIAADGATPAEAHVARLKFYFAVGLATLVWAVTPISWVVVLRALHKLYVSQRGFSLRAVQSLSPRPIRAAGVLLPLRPLVRFWSFFRWFYYYYSWFEVPFSVYLLYLTRRASPRRAPPPVELDRLETLLVSCLEVGLPHADPAKRGVPPTEEQRLRSIGGRLPPKDARKGGLAALGRVVTPEAAAETRAKLVRWFHNAPIESVRADNVREWLAWAFLGRELADAQANPEVAQLVELSLELVQERLDYRFQPGYNPDAKAIRLTLDPLAVAHRPFGYYVVTNGVTAASIAYLRAFKGFRRERHGACEFLVLPPKSAAERKQHANGKDAAAKLPILFMHGLGIGLGQYVPFMKRLSTHAPGVIVMLQPNISGTITSAHFLDAPSEAEHVDAILRVTAAHGVREATIVSHSNGTMLHGWILRAKPELCRRNILVDPVSFRLWEGSVCYNFLYKKPHNMVAVLLKYFVSQELSVANTICRRFNWSSMALWIPDFASIAPSDLHFVFSEHDVLVDVPACTAYLREEGVRDESITVMPRYQHGQPLFLAGDGMRAVCKHAHVEF